MKPQRVSFWKNNKNWTIYQLVFLLKQQEPIPLEKLDGFAKAEIEKELEVWKLLVTDGPRQLAIDEYPLTTRCNSTELLDWVSKLDGIAIPKIWHPLLSKSGKPTYNEDQHNDTMNNSISQQLGDRERETLLAIIGALALVIVDKTKDQTGTLDNPNYTGVANLVIRTHGKVPGMAGSTLRGRFSKGVKELMKNGVEILKAKKVAS